ncbi:MAG TPA: carboxypeptidase regulatory-like domain-containing protein [Vicinamibacterales bacterium]|jgi:plastocyanin
MTCHRRLIVFVIAVAIGLVVALPGAHAAGPAITGTVKATGLSSNADAVVFVVQAPGTFKPPAEPMTMDQKQFQFIPHVMPVVLGTVVKFLNSDPTPHNVFSPDFEKYNLGTWPQGQTKDRPFAACAKFPCVYTQLCRVHPEMEGFVVVVQNPYFGVTDKAGHFAIDGVPPGSYTLAVWHPKLKAQPKPVIVEAGKPATVDFVLAR